MQSTKSEAQYTQEGQSISYNNLTCQQLIELFEPCLGPNGTYKALVNGGQQLNLTKDGIALCRDIKYNHPTSIVITRSANSIFDRVGDGINTYILMVCNIFNESFAQFTDGAKIPHIVNSLQLAVEDVSQHLRKNILPLDDKNLQALIKSSLSTKIRNCDFLVDIVVQALKHTSDIKLIETIKMEGGDLKDSRFVAGLVLDHGPRHADMPTEMEDVCVLTVSMSMEYEKPEINAEFVYNTIQQREEFAKAENDFILEKVESICVLARECKKKGKSLLLVNEKGIDPVSLEKLAAAGVLALRRAKRRNLERLTGICGGKIVSTVEQVNQDSLGYCKKVSVKKSNDESFTFVEGVPLKGACTILVRGNVDYARIRQSIRGTLIAVMLAINDKCCIRGGKQLYVDLIKMLKSKDVHSDDSVGYEILAKVFEKICKALIKNEGNNAQKEMAELIKNGEKNTVVDNAVVIGNVFTNSVFTAVNLLMCDEMILAGRSIKE